MMLVILEVPTVCRSPKVVREPGMRNITAYMMGLGVGSLHLRIGTGLAEQIL